MPEVTLKKFIDNPIAGEADNQKENARRALIKAGEIPASPRVPVPVPPQPQSLSKAKQIKALIHLCVRHQARHLMMSSNMCLASSGYRRVQE